MPNPTASNVIAGRPKSTGGVLLGQGTGSLVLPTDATTDPGAAFLAAGYIGEDGLTMSVGRDTKKIKAWGNSIVKVTQTDHSVTFQWTFIETLNVNVEKAVFGANNVTFTAATLTAGNRLATKITADQLPHMPGIFEVKDGLARVRLAVPDLQITEQGDVVFNDGDVIAYQVTAEAFEDINGVKVYKYSDDGKLTTV